MTFEQWLQSRLTAHGFPVGVIDGKIGPITTAALRAFQAARGLSITGTSTQETITALRDGPPIDDGVVRPEPRPSGWPRQSDVGSYYGRMGESQGRLDLPFPMRLAWAKGTLITKITLHQKVIESAGRAFEAIASAYSPGQRADLGIDLFGGSFNVRKMRGGTKWSMHSWGIAIDFDPERNQMTWGRDRARLAQPDAESFWAAWEAEGWTSLGWSYGFDFMHVEATSGR